VGIETRPPFLTVQRLEAVVEALPSNVTDLTLGFGLECISDLPRMVAVNKGYGPLHVERAIEVIDEVRNRHEHLHIGFEVYVLLKPLFLSEQEAIDEALRTIEWVFEHSAETAVLFMNTIKENTLQGYVNARPQMGPHLHYQPPYYRSAIEVLRQLPDEYRARTVVLGPQSAVPARGMPRGCALCTWPLTGALIAHNLYRDSGILHAAAQSTCPCRSQWQMELGVPDIPLTERVRDGLALLEAEFGLAH
jgi:radical SAM enzyme (TIGR01210 family)